MWLWAAWAALPILLLLQPLPVAAGEFDPADNPWGFGYDEGPTLRRKLAGKWEIGIAGGPNDFLRENSDKEVGESIPPSVNDSTLADSEVRREGGFVALHLGRSVWQRQSFDLICFLRGQFEWANRGEISDRIRYYNSEVSRSLFVYDADTRIWALSLAFRPGYRPVPWFSIEVEFGVRYSWTHEESRRESTNLSQDGSRNTDVRISESDGQSFRHFGYSGTSSFNFIVWF